MNLGDLVKYCGKEHTRSDRISGVILGFDLYEAGPCGLPAGSSPNYPQPTPIVLVLWARGPGWISRNQIEVIDESR